MASYYYFFVSTLPLLKLFEEAPLSTEDFLAESAKQLSAADWNILDTTELVPQNDNNVPHDTMTYAWNNFEKTLRNRIARQVAGNSDKGKTFERDTEGCLPEIELAVSEAWSQGNPLEREKVLDRWRWRFLDDQEGRKAFGSLGFICMYKIKLQIIEKWDRRKLKAGQTNLTQVLEKCGTINEEEK